MEIPLPPQGLVLVIWGVVLVGTLMFTNGQGIKLTNSQVINLMLIELLFSGTLVYILLGTVVAVTSGQEPDWIPRVVQSTVYIVGAVTIILLEFKGILVLVGKEDSQERLF